MLLSQTLAGFCYNSGWNYAIFWKLKQQPRTVLMWEDAFFPKPPMFCGMGSMPGMARTDGTFCKGEKSVPDFGQLGLVVSKMSYHMYSLGEGIIGRVAFTGKHQWFYMDAKGISDSSSSVRSLWEKYPAGWQDQFAAGIQTIAIIAVPQGVVQLGSVLEMKEDPNLVEHIRKVFSTLEKIPGVFLSDLIENSDGQRASSAGTNMGSQPAIFGAHNQMMVMGMGFNTGGVPMDLQMGARMPKLVPYVPGIIQPGMMFAPQPFIMGMRMGPQSQPAATGKGEMPLPGGSCQFMPGQGCLPGPCHNLDGQGPVSLGLSRPGSTIDSVHSLQSIPAGKIKLPLGTVPAYRPWSTQEEDRAHVISPVNSQPVSMLPGSVPDTCYSPNSIVVNSGSLKLSSAGSQQSTSRTVQLQKEQLHGGFSVNQCLEKSPDCQGRLQSTMENEGLMQLERALEAQAYNLEATGSGLKEEPLLFLQNSGLNQLFSVEDSHSWEPGPCFGRGSMATHLMQTANCENGLVSRDRQLVAGQFVNSKKWRHMGGVSRQEVEAPSEAAEWRTQNLAQEIGMYGAGVVRRTDFSHLHMEAEKRTFDSGIACIDVDKLLAPVSSFSERDGVHEMGISGSPHTSMIDGAGLFENETCGKGVGAHGLPLEGRWEHGHNCDQGGSVIVSQLGSAILRGSNDENVEHQSMQALNEVLHSSSLCSSLQLESENGGPGSPETLEEILQHCEQQLPFFDFGVMEPHRTEHCEQQLSLFKPVNLGLDGSEPAKSCAEDINRVSPEQTLHGAIGKRKRISSAEGSIVDDVATIHGGERAKARRRPLVAMTPLSYFEKDKVPAVSTPGAMDSVPPRNSQWARKGRP